MDINKEIAKELEAEAEALRMAEFAPKSIDRTPVNAAKYAWMFVAISIDIATAYVVYLMTTWWYGVLWFLAAAGGLIFAEWLWERIGNNEKQEKISRTSKNVSAVSVLVMALLTGVAYIMGFTSNLIVESLVLVVTISLFAFHGWQAYQYHENDDDYIAATYDAREEAKNQKEIRMIHRAGRRIEAKKVVYGVGASYQDKHKEAFTAAAGRSFASETKKPENFTEAGKQ